MGEHAAVCCFGLAVPGRDVAFLPLCALMEENVLEFRTL